MLIRDLVLAAMLVVFAAPGREGRAGPLTVQPQTHSVLIKQQGVLLPVSLKAPRFVIGDRAVGGETPKQSPGEIPATGCSEISYAPVALDGSARLEVRLLVEWSAREETLRKWARFRLTGAAPLLLKEVVLEEIDLRGLELLPAPAQPVIQPPQSYPVFLRGFFAGVEFPISATRLERDRLVLAHRPGLRLEPGKWHETSKAVFGLAPPGSERQAFERYIDAHRPAPKELTINYNHWWSTPVRAAEQDILGLMAVFDRELYRRHGVSPDTFCIDVGWQDPQSLWQMDKRSFPQGFAAVRKEASKMKTALGIWISPSSVYPQAHDIAWSKAHGYETSAVVREGQAAPFACLGGRKYRAAFRERIVEMIRQYDLRSIKLDGYIFQCNETGHGHEPGELSAEAIADGMIEVLRAAREAGPDVWLRPTCFGWNPSPWWLFYTNSVIGSFGDDSPYGRVPAPIYRESCTSARDYYNLQGTARSPLPIAASEVLGIVHQSADPFLNDAVMTVMRGHAFVPMYLNPRYMNERRWAGLADVISWARRNASPLRRTVPLLPASWQRGEVPRFSDADSMPREPYGYAHWDGPRGLVVLRNPWIAPQSYALKPPYGADHAGTQQSASVVSLYPAVRLYSAGCRAGQTLSIPLAPYETLVLSVGPRQPIQRLPNARDVLAAGIGSVNIRRQACIATYAADPGPLGPDWTSPTGTLDRAIHLQLTGDVEVRSTEAELLVLLEGPGSPTVPVSSCQVNGKPAPVETMLSDAGFASTVLPAREHWTFARVRLPHGKSAVDLSLVAEANATAVSAWLWACDPPGEKSDYPNALANPERISLGSVALFGPIGAGDIPCRPTPVRRAIDRIDGVYLDAIEPHSAVQGWGMLQKNRSVWEKPMNIAGKPYVRGLGTSSQSRISYALNGQFRRFQSWVGADHATNPTVTFEVWTDGVRRWESGLMKRDDPAKRCDVDVTGARMLELRVGDGGDGISADHADWAEARLLR